MLITDPCKELNDGRKYWIAPYMMWNWVSASETESCFLVSLSDEHRKALWPFSTTIISTVEHLLEYAINDLCSRCKVYLVQQVIAADGSRGLCFPEIDRIGVYEGVPAGIRYYALFDKMGVSIRAYETQPPIPERTSIQILAVFNG